MIIPFLKSVALTEPDVELAKAALYSLGNFKTKESVEAMKNVFKNSKVPEVRKAALYALGDSDISDISG